MSFVIEGQIILLLKLCADVLKWSVTHDILVSHMFK